MEPRDFPPPGGRRLRSIRQRRADWIATGVFVAAMVAVIFGAAFVFRWYTH